MMYLILSVLAITIYSTNAASVVAVFDDVDQQSLTSEDCNYQACDQLCRRLGFPGGACVGDRCKCDNFLQSKAGQQSLSSEDCNYQACDQLCRRLGFPGGACVGDRCKCDNFLQSAADQQSLSSEDCNYQACDQLCRRLGFPGGACVGDRCKCDNFLQSVAGPQSLSSEDCNYQACDQLCRRLGFPGGACVGDRCKCDNFLQSQGVNVILQIQSEHRNDQDSNHQVEKSELRSSSSISRGNCDCVPRNCDVYCFRMHYTGGICVTGQCRCYR